MPPEMAEVIGDLSRSMLLFAVAAWVWLGVREGLRWLRNDG